MKQSVLNLKWTLVTKNSKFFKAINREKNQNIPNGTQYILNSDKKFSEKNMDSPGNKTTSSKRRK